MIRIRFFITKSRLRFFIGSLLVLLAAPYSHGAHYIIDSDFDTMDSSIHFTVRFLGVGVAKGEFTKFKGEYQFEPHKLTAAKMAMTIDTASLETEDVVMTKKIRGPKYFDVEQFPEARFFSTYVQVEDDNNFTLNGLLTLHGITKSIAIQAQTLWTTDDPGGKHLGFKGTSEIKLTDFGIRYGMFPNAVKVKLFLTIEGKNIKVEALQ